MINNSVEVKFVTISNEEEGQRIDNFLITYLKGVPKSLVYRIIRKGEVRVNKKRVKPEYKIAAEDIIRIPPVRFNDKKEDSDAIALSPKLDRIAELEQSIIFEDDVIIAINKPSGIAVHGGSGLLFGVIEGMRALRPQAKFLELVHRIDRDTSGLLLIAKKRSALRSLHEQLRSKTIKKSYLALVKGQWQDRDKVVKAPLLKMNLSSGDRLVRVDIKGKEAETRFEVLERFNECTLIKASPVTGRTHQIRVHTLHAGHPIACDDRYGDKEFDQKMAKVKINRLFLHAHQIQFTHPKTEKRVELTAELEPSLKLALKQLRNL